MPSPRSFSSKLTQTFAWNHEWLLQNSYLYSCSDNVLLGKIWADQLALNINLRFKVLIQENVISVELKAVFVIYDDLLDALEAAHKYVVDVFEHCPDPRSAVLGSEVSSELLHRPLAYLWRNKEETSDWTLLRRKDAVQVWFFSYSPIPDHNLEQFFE